jgi:hypothetical protein
MQTNDQYPNDAVAGDALKSDTVPLTIAAVGFYVGTTGDVIIKTLKGNTVTFKNVPVGFQYFIGIAQLMSTGCTATNIVLYLA